MPQWNEHTREAWRDMNLNYDQATDEGDQRSRTQYFRDVFGIDIEPAALPPTPDSFECICGKPITEDPITHIRYEFETETVHQHKQKQPQPRRQPSIERFSE